MESSSDQSFAWTDASNDSIDSDVMVANNEIKEQSDNESEYGKSYKKKLQKELFAYNGGDNENELQQKGKKRKITNEIHEDLGNESPRKKKIKLEPESDIEPSDKKKKSKYSERLRLTSQGSLSNDESYLNLRVKEEMAFKVPSPIVTKKKKKKKELDSETNGENDLSDLSTSLQLQSNDDTSCNDYEDITQMMEYEGEQTKEKKRKKKKKRKDASEEESETVFVNIKDKFSKEETVVESCYTSNSNEFNNSSEELMGNQNNWDLDSGKQLDRDNAKKCKEKKNSTLQSEEVSDKNELLVRSNQKQSCDPDSIQTNSNNNLDIPEKTNLRISRLSDRIRFEDEDSLHINKTGPNEIVDLGSRKLEKFLKVKENLKPISTKLKNESILTQDDEVWIVKCPHDVVVNAFQDITIPLNKKIKIKVDGSTYEGSIEDHINAVTVLSQLDSTFVLKNLPSKGVINFRKRVPKVHIRDDVVMINNQTDFIPLPETKVRHPLFGSNYKRSIKVPGTVKERLDASLTVVNDDRKKVTKQKKNKHMLKDADVMFHIETKHEPQSLEVSKKKSKKRKHNGSNEHIFVKAKQQKYDINSAEVWDSEKAIEENLFNF